jgi:tetraacyldisaccharide 4'-kinase
MAADAAIARGLKRLWRAELTPAGRAMQTALIPASLLYGAGGALRSWYWRRAGAESSSIKVVSVGNLTVGGSGKTPFTLYLARKLTERGVRIGIVSRGYGGSRSGGEALLVSDGRGAIAAPEVSGDEPAMMARSFAGPIAIARRRIDALRLLERRGGVDVAILDDGYQHIRLRRDLNLMLVNRERGFGNGWMLPAGPLREPLSAIARADAVILLSFAPGEPSGLATNQMRILERLPLLHGTVTPRALISCPRWREVPLALAGHRILAVNGLADASAFHAMLRGLGAKLAAVLEYPDHHRYTAGDAKRVADAARAADLIVTTEKDLVKLEQFPFAADSLYALRVEVAMGADEQRLLEMVERAIGLPRAAAAPNQSKEALR